MAYLLKESGHDKLLEAILSGARMSTVNFSEVATRYVLRRADEAQVQALRARLPFPLEPLGDEVATTAALMASSRHVRTLRAGDLQVRPRRQHREGSARQHQRVTEIGHRLDEDDQEGAGDTGSDSGDVFFQNTRQRVAPTFSAASSRTGLIEATTPRSERYAMGAKVRTRLQTTPWNP